MMMSERTLKVFLFYAEANLASAESLSKQLTWDGLDVTIFDYSTLEQDAEDFDDPAGRKRREEVQKSLLDASAILFCLSKAFDKRSAAGLDWQFVLDGAAGKTQGSVSILPIRLDDCTVPDLLERWIPIDLFEKDGYEKLMQAMKFQADMEKIELKTGSDWMDKFLEKEPDSETGPEERRGMSLGRIVLFVSIVLAVVFFVWMINNGSAGGRLPSVDVLAENATKNVQANATSRAIANTADVLSISVPLTQTSVYLTAVALTQTEVEFQARITPSVTMTPTATLTPTPTLTVVSIPVNIVGVGNVSMVLVPGGSFTMGNDADDDASPSLSMYLKPYYIDQFEVTNTLYQKCVQAGVCQPPASTNSQTRQDYYGPTVYANYPVINVDWNNARAFCEWRNARLPTEAEWEKAARGTESRSYPWGEEALCPFANYTAPEGPCIGDTQPVDRYKASGSAYNVYNMAGNVAEWVGSLYLPYPYKSSDDRENSASDGPRVVRGGSWAASAGEILTYHRLGLDPASNSIYGNDLGFRCAQDANP